MGQEKDQERSATDHWQFSLAVYTREGVAGHCLALQNRLGLDVNVLLMMLWAAGQWGDAPTAQQIEAADKMIVAWRQEVVVPLRQLRTRLKSGPAPAPDAATDLLREEVKRLELDAERLQQDVLAQWVKEQTLARTRAGQGGITQDMNTGSPSPSAVVADSAAEHGSQSQSSLADTAENASQLAVLEQTAVRVVAHYEAAYVQTAADEGTWAGHAANEQAADPWLALQHAHQVVLAALAVLCQI